MDCDEIKENSDINQLLNSFSSLQTNEKDDLVVGFQNIANELSYTTARFFLEMNNWWAAGSSCCYWISLFTFPLLRIVHDILSCVCACLSIAAFRMEFSNFLIVDFPICFVLGIFKLQSVATSTS